MTPSIHLLSTVLIQEKKPANKASPVLILGIETSCDETAAAVLDSDYGIRSDVVHSQTAVHARFGGVVPELASRSHMEWISPVVEQALVEAEAGIGDMDAVAVTQGPGLVGSLLVGFSFAKALAAVRGIPCVGVDHLTGHLAAVFLGDDPPPFPHLALTVSGGHSSLFLVESPVTAKLLGRTIDDAAGEAFDKTAKLLGLGYPGGPAISLLATRGDRNRIHFPRSRLAPGSLDFSFSGLKTAVASYVKQSGLDNEGTKADIAASFEEAVCDILVEKTLLAARKTGLGHVVLAGGVAANPRLRELLALRGQEAQLRVHLTPFRYCTDNAAMIALAGGRLLDRGESHGADADVYSRPLYIQ